jgi:divalent metal cation (Fe/Co/Zn/Cd) transporter
MYYYLPEPPYFLILVGLFAGITSGLAFEATLKQIVQEWSKTLANEKLDQAQGFKLQFPFLGICLGVCVFLASGLEVFLLNRWLAYAIALPMTIFIAALVWIQLGKLLQQLKVGGSKAIDLDAF